MAAPGSFPGCGRPGSTGPGAGSAAEGPVFPRANGGVGGSDLIKEGGDPSHIFKIIL